MVKPSSHALDDLSNFDLKALVLELLGEGYTHRAAAAQFRVSIKFVNDMVLLKRATGSLEAKQQGNGGGHGKLAGVAGWIRGRIKEKRDLTLDELVVELRDESPRVYWRVKLSKDEPHGTEKISPEVHG
jgi:transposase